MLSLSARPAALLLALLIMLPGAVPLVGAVAPVTDSLEGAHGILASHLAAGAAPEPTQGRADDWLVPDRVIVSFDADLAAVTLALQSLAAGHGGHLLRVDPTLKFAVVSTTPDVRDAAIKAAMLIPGVTKATPDMRVEALFMPNDPHYSMQWGAPAIGMPAAWDVTLGGHSRTVAILDTGVWATHPDLAANMCVLGPDYPNGDNNPDDDHGHGTHVAGTVAAVINNAAGVAGMANACLMSVKVLDGGGSGTFADVASGIVWAADNGAHVISMSLGGCPGCDPGDIVRASVEYAAAQGVLIVAAAGNAGCAPVSYPAAYPEVMAIAALRPPGDEAAWFSSCGPEVEVAAPGEGIISTAITSGPLSDPSGYMYLSGTSMATPHVAGVAALVWSNNVSLSAAQLRCILLQTADDLGPAGHDPVTGYGRVNAPAAMGASCIPQPPGAPMLNAYGLDGGARLRWTAPGSIGSEISEYRIYRGDSPSNLSLVATVPQRVWNDTGLTNDVTYHYAVAAVNDVGEGPSSNVRAVTPMAPRTLPYVDDFETGAAGWSATGLWHLTNDRSNSSSTSWYYGQENGPGLEDNHYDTGRANRGELLSPLVDLRNATEAGLTFWQFFAGEGGNWEHPIVDVSTQGPEGPWMRAYENPARRGTGVASVDLTAFVGATIVVRFVWDTRDAIDNHHEGWYIDDVQFEAVRPPPSCLDAGDAYGYTCEPVDIHWREIGLTGTPISLGDDQVSGAIPIPFPFRFYGLEKPNVYVSSNGFLTFTETYASGCCSGPALPSSYPPNDVVAAHWSDLFPPGGGSVKYATVGEVGSRVFVVQFTDIPYCCSWGGPAATFQFQIHEGTDLVEVHYLRTDPGPYGGASSGIEDCNGESGLLFAYGWPRLDGRAVRYTPPMNAPACIPDEPPIVEIWAPTEGATLSGNSNVSGRAWNADGDGVWYVTVAIDDGPAYTAEGTDPFTFTFHTTQYADGPHWVTVRAFDQYGMGQASVTFTISNGNTPPFVAITSPAPGSTVGGMVAIAGTASDVDGPVAFVEVRVDGGAWWTAAGTTSWNSFWDATGTWPGWHQIEARAFDGIAYSDHASVLVFVPSGFADLVVRDDEIRVDRRPIQTDFGSAPNLVNERRTIRAIIHNDGESNARAFDVLFVARAEAAAFGRRIATSEEIGVVRVPALAAGASIEVRIFWDTTDNVGDHEIVVTVDARNEVLETNERNNEGVHESWVRVGGLGGISPGSIPG